jgi:hypothetical protein
LNWTLRDASSGRTFVPWIPCATSSSAAAASASRSSASER